MATEMFFDKAFADAVQAEVPFFRRYLMERCLAGNRPSVCGVAAIGFAVKVFGEAAARNGEAEEFKAMLLQFISDNYKAGVEEAREDRHEV